MTATEKLPATVHIATYSYIILSVIHIH